MKNTAYILLFILCLLSCGKEQMNPTNTPDPDVEINEETTEENPEEEEEDEEEEAISPDNYFRFATYQISIEDPFDVNVLFPVSDSLSRGISGLGINDFLVKEREEVIPVTEANAVLRPFGTFPIELKTAIVVDVSTSVASDLENLKIALKSLIDLRVPYQQLAIYSFSSQVNLEIDYSEDNAALKRAIDNLQLGTTSTDLYGAIVEAADSFENGFTEELITIGNLIVFTDGDDTQASTSFQDAQAAIDNKNTYFIGVEGPDLDETTIRNLVGSNFYFLAKSIDTTSKDFREVQDEVVNYAESVYFLNYESPKRGNNIHSLRIELKENINPEGDYSAFGEFSSVGFYDPIGPSKATLISPSLGEAITLENKCSLTLEVGRSVDPDIDNQDTITYEFYFGTDINELEKLNEITVSPFVDVSFETPTGLIKGQTYFWRIDSSDNDSIELMTTGDVWDFVFNESVYVGNLTLTSINEVNDFCFSRVSGSLSISRLTGDSATLDLTVFDVLERIGLGSSGPEVTLSISNNESDLNLSGVFPNLEIVTGSVSILNNTGSLVLNNSFENLTRIVGDRSGGSLNIVGNSKLQEIIGFNQLGTIGNFGAILNLRDNKELQLVSGFNYLERGILYLSGVKIESVSMFNNVNRLGLMSISTILPTANLELASSAEIMESLTVTNVTSINFENSFQNLSYLGRFELVGSEVDVIKLDSPLTMGIGIIEVNFCPNLRIIDFPNVQTTGLTLFSAPQLEILNFPKLNRLTNGFISGTAMYNFQGMENVKIIDGLDVSQNDNLLTFDGLGNGVELQIGSGGIRANQNRSLRDFCNLIPGITTQFPVVFSVANNFFNPSRDDMINGNCEN